MPDLRYCIIVLLVCFCLMNGENPEPKRRKYRVGTKTKATASKMAAQSGKNTGQDKKDSPSLAKPSKPGAPSSFPAGSSVFGAPTYFPTNPWQNDQNSRFDYIVEKLAKIESNQNTFLVRLGDIENKLTQTNIKVTEIENSQSHLSHQFDDINSSTKMHKTDIQKLQGDVKNLTDENQSLKEANRKIKDDVIDLKCRSMRDNLLFFGIPESVSQPVDAGALGATGGPDDVIGGAMGGHAPMEGLSSADKTDDSTPATPASFAKVVETGEDCAKKVFEFCEHVLHIENPRSKIQIDRAHRIGARSVGKTRPIVAKFVRSEHKALIKSALSNVNLNNPPYNGAFKVNDQFPPEVIARRKELIPKLISERKNGNKATLVRDKLYVNNKLVE